MAAAIPHAGQRCSLLLFFDHVKKKKMKMERNDRAAMQRVLLFFSSFFSCLFVYCGVIVGG